MRRNSITKFQKKKTEELSKFVPVQKKSS